MNAKFDDLVGVAYAECDCWALARRALDRLGRRLPESPAEALADRSRYGRPTPPGTVAQVGDLVHMAGPPGSEHVGVVIADRPLEVVLHTSSKLGASVVNPLSSLRRAGCVLAVWRIGAATRAAGGGEPS